MPRSIYASCLLVLSLLVSVPATEASENELGDLVFECRDATHEVRVVQLEDGRSINVCKIGDHVTVRGTFTETWRAQASEKKVVDKLVLTLNGQPLVGGYGRWTGEGLTFDLVRDQSNKANMAAWKTLLVRTKLFDPEVMKIALASEGSIERYGEADIGIVVASDFRLWTVAVAYLVLLAGFAYLVACKDLLRDPGPQPAAGKKPFSLGYTQMAFWFFVVLGSLLYVWLAAGDLSVLTPGVLGLIGISAATGLASTVVGTSKQTALPDELVKLDEERRTLNVRLQQLEQDIAKNSAGPDLDALRLEQAQKEKRLATVNGSLGKLVSAPRSRGFFADILGSDGEVSLPRFQMAAWTLVLGIVFVHSVFTTLNMPEFDATLLGLMGLSSGTYVGFKVPALVGK